MLASALELGGGVFTSVVFLMFVAVHSLQLNMLGLQRHAQRAAWQGIVRFHSM